MPGSYVCYLLTAPGTFRTYIGITNDMAKRLRQHNGEIKGGAKYTTRYSNQWEKIMVVGEFAEKGDALRFEWAAKHSPDRKRVISGVRARVARMASLAAEHDKLVLTCLRPGMVPAGLGHLVIGEDTEVDAAAEEEEL